MQRFPLLVGEQRARELAYTGRHFYGEEAYQMGLALSCKRDVAELDATADALAETIASKSPITMRGVKKAITYQRDHITEDALEQVRQWNASMLYSSDLTEAFNAHIGDRKPSF